MDQSDAIARARAIAAKLNVQLGAISSPDMGAPKKRGRWGDGEDQAPRKKKKIYIPRDNPEINFMGLLIGPRGSTQKRLEEASGARILIRGRGSEREGEAPSSHPDDDDELHVSIEGSDEAIETATKEVEAIIFNPQEAMRLKQQQLRNLAEMNGALRGGPGGDGDGHYGPPGGGARAKPGLGYGGDAHYGPGPGGADEEVEEVHVPQNMVGLIIGKGGENIQRMQQQSGASVQVAKDPGQPGDTTRVVTLRGARPAVDEARRMIQEILDSRERRQGPGEGHYGGGGGDGGGGGGQHQYGMIATLQVPVPNDKVGLVIGRGGMTIRAIQDKTGAHVQIPREGEGEDPHSRLIIVSAPNHEAAEAAQAEILSILEGRRSGGGGGGSVPQALVMHVNNDKIGLIIGRAGANIKDLQARTGTRIQIPPEVEPGSNPPYRVVSITGPADAPERARYEIESMIMNDVGRFGRGGFGGYQPSPAFTVPVAPPAYPHGPPMHPAYGHDPYYGAYAQDPYAAYHQQHYAYGHDPSQHAAYPPHAQHGGHDPAAAHPGEAAAQNGAAAGQEGEQPKPAQEGGEAGAGATNGGEGGEKAEGETDMTAYYDQYWQYAAYYGEAYAKQAYGAWAPPEGTLPPPGVTLPEPGQEHPPPTDDPTKAHEG